MCEYVLNVTNVFPNASNIILKLPTIYLTQHTHFLLKALSIFCLNIILFFISEIYVKVIKQENEEKKERKTSVSPRSGPAQ